MADYLTIINAAYRKIGNKNPTTTEINDAKEMFNDMLGIMGVELLFPYPSRESFTLTIGQDTYTIGSGGTINTTRPINILSLYIRDSDNIDSPIKIISREAYNLITEKSQSGKPTKAYYIPEYPLSKLIFNYDLDKAYTAFFEFERNFTEVGVTSATVTLPNEYRAMLIYNLAVILAEDTKQILPQSVYANAKYYKNMVCKIRAITRTVPLIRFPVATAGASLNITTDDWNE